MQIRPIQSRDQERVKELISGILSKEFQFGHSAYPYGDLDSIDKVYGGKREQFFVMGDDGEIAGTVGIKEESKKTAIIRRLFVNPSSRKKGFGGLLLDRALDFCKEKDYHEAVFHAATTMKSAIKLCRSRGFKETEKLVSGGIDIIKFVVTF
ncbi:MAG: GNAT family N-acetyltransferase [Candidatus Omnitrophica bacterium]|nr:GNAT family N-acetyltransferase [Candidatus Omnitrophota bacterium]